MILIFPVIAFQLCYVPLNDILARFHHFLVTFSYYRGLTLFLGLSSTLFKKFILKLDSMFVFLAPPSILRSRTEFCLLRMRRSIISLAQRYLIFCFPGTSFTAVEGTKEEREDKDVLMS